MRAAVVVILATITGIAALLSFQPGSLDNFGAPASASRGAEVVAIPDAEGDDAQNRVRPSTEARPSRSVERESPAQEDDQAPAEAPPDGGEEQQVKVPEGCRIALDGQELRVTDENDRIVNLTVPKNGTLTIRCDENGVQRETEVQDPGDGQQPADPPADPEPSAPAGDEGDGDGGVLPDPGDVLPADPADGTDQGS